MILLDTNVISELMKPAPDPRVRAWVLIQPRQNLFTCTIAVAEVLSGLDLMPAGKRRTQLLDKTEFMFANLFAGRILDFDLAAARHLGPVLKRLARQENQSTKWMHSSRQLRSAIISQSRPGILHILRKLRLN